MWMRTATGSATTAVIMQAETARAEIMWTPMKMVSAIMRKRKITIAQMNHVHGMERSIIMAEADRVTAMTDTSTAAVPRTE